MSEVTIFRVPGGRPWSAWARAYDEEQRAREHCSACGRKLREKRVAYPGWVFVDWLNHHRDCPRYGLSPDV